MKKKILIFHPFLAPYRIDLYNKLSETFELTALLTMSTAKMKKMVGFDLEKVNSNAHFSFKYVTKGIYFGHHLISFVYFTTIWKFKPTIILAHELGVNTLAAILLKPLFNYKIVITVDDSPSMTQSYSKLRSLLQRFVISRVNTVLVIHPEVKKYLEKKYKSQRSCEFIYLPIIQNEKVLTDKLEAADNDVKLLIERHQLAGKKIILFVGRLVLEKSPEMLLRAFTQIDTKDKVLIFVGDGVLRNDLEELVERKGLKSHVLFMGRLSGVPLYAWFRLADVFVLPSRFEPFGAVVNEALVAGCKVVISDRVGATAIVSDSNGSIFNYENEKELVDNLKIMLSGVHVDNQKGKLKESKMPILFGDFISIFQKIV
jgi:glycosyltransferase involved in cell wall biosynthesis